MWMTLTQNIAANVCGRPRSASRQSAALASSCVGARRLPSFTCARQAAMLRMWLLGLIRVGICGAIGCEVDAQLVVQSLRHRR
jgi:hypothetical protein